MKTDWRYKLRYRWNEGLLMRLNNLANLRLDGKLKSNVVRMRKDG